MEDLIELFGLPNNAVAILYCLLIALLSGLIIFVFAKRAKLLRPTAMSGDWPRLLLVSLFVPAIPEEIIFRGLWYRADFALIEIVVWACITTIAFVLWHIFEGMTFLKAHKATFLKHWFLVCTAVLGITNSALIMVSNSIWPAIVFHWLLVFIWQSRYGGVVFFPTKKS